MRAVFLRTVEADDKGQALRHVIEMAGRGTNPGGVYLLKHVDLLAVPGAPFCYWAGPSVREAFTRFSPFELDGRVATRGASTCDDFRYVRLWTEHTSSRAAPYIWHPFVKGGRFSRHYAALLTCVDWDPNRETFRGFVGRPGRWQERPEGLDYYFRPALTWPLRGASFSSQAVPSGSIFSVGGKVALAPIEQLSALMALFNSVAFNQVLSLFAAKVSGFQFEVGVIARTPVPDLTPADGAALGALAHRAWSLKRSLDTRTETSHAFILPALLQTTGLTLGARSAVWTERVQAAEAELSEIQAEIDERCFTLYGIDEEDRRAITEGFGESSPDAEGSEDGADADTEDEAEADAAADTATLAAELVSWAVGVAFGRFDVRLATGARELPAEPEPFDPLPVCSPAMLTGDDGLPLAHPPAGYPLSFSADGIFVDDPGHPRDLTTAVRAVFDTVFGTTADAIWQETAALLDPKGHELRTWLAKEFFGHHLARHSKSRRKAPILWQLGTPSARYSTWLYAHRLTRDSLFALSRDVVAPKLALEERRQTSLVQESGLNPTAKQRAELAAQDAVVAELRTFADEVRRVAPLWNPDLDDGIVLVESPLWRLVPHKPWQKELKSRWDDLVAGMYDWAHLAMRLWPERVVPKCVADRSLAIAHGLEDVFWLEGADGKWTKRARPTRSVEELVTERGSPAVKAALADLLAAPAIAIGRRGRGSGE